MIRLPKSDLSFPGNPRLLLSLFISFALLCSFALTSVSAVKNKKAEAKRAEIRSKMKALKGEIAKRRSEKTRITETIRRIDEESNRIQKEMNENALDLKKTEAQEKYYQKKYVESSNKYKAYKKIYKNRLVSFYKTSHAGYIEVLINASSFSDFLSRMSLLRMITRNDQKAIAKLNELRNDVEAKKEHVEQAKYDMEVARDVLAQNKAYNADLHNEKTKTLKSVENDLAEQEAELQELEEESRKIEADLQSSSMKAREFKGAFHGKLGSPLCGRTVRSLNITSGFGYRKRPTKHASIYHQGLDIGAYHGAAVCAAADGVVLQTSLRGGYGNTVMVSHGSGIVTLYGHGLVFKVREGAQVKRGQLIMLADNSGVSTGDHLHFEVRVNGRLINPAGYLY